MILPTVHAGDRVAFRATVQNVGDGATPHDTPAAITFFVDGKYASYAVTDGTPILAGESRQLVAGGLWTAPAGSHTIEAQVDDIDRIPEERSKSNNYIDRTLRVDITGAGVLDGSADPAPGAVELSREGTLDWAAWGLGGKNVCNRNAGGPNDISDMRFVGSGYYDTTPGCPMAASWTNGAPTTTTSGSHSGLWLNGVGHGYCFDVPADSTLRILRVYVAGLEGAGCTLVAHLSDSSAPDYVSSTFDGNLAQVWAPVPDGFAGMYTIRYRAATPDQKLTVTWKLSSEPNRFLGQARLQAATLARGD